MDSFTSSVSSHSNGNGDLTDTATLASDAILTQIQKIWDRHRQQGLEDRHRTGALLNKKFGASNVRRQAYGERVLKAYSAHLGISVSELSRMRRFATNFKSVEDMKAQHPDVKTWTQVKKLLVSTRKTETQQAETPNGIAQKKPAGNQPLSQVIQSIRAVRQCISQVQLAPQGDERTSLGEVVKEMLADIEKILGVRYVLENQLPPVMFSPLEDPIRHAPMAVVA